MRMQEEIKKLVKAGSPSDDIFLKIKKSGLQVSGHALRHKISKEFHKQQEKKRVKARESTFFKGNLPVKDIRKPYPIKCPLVTNAESGKYLAGTV